MKESFVVEPDSPKGRAATAIRESEAELVELSHRIHGKPELAFQERFASGLLADLLESQGFSVERGAFGLETSFLARVGEGATRVVFCAEYDALPDIGHACGHNVIAAAAVGAGVGAATVADELGLTVDVLGTPAEETAGGKAILIERGAFEGASAAMMVHPAPVDILDAPYLAVTDIVFTAVGEAAHASLGPRTRRGNALDAIVDTYVALRELELGPYERCHGVITDGGKAPNVVPERASASYFVRARTRDELEALLERVREAAARKCEERGCRVEFSGTGIVVDDVLSNPTLLSLYERNASALGRRFLPQDRITPEMAASTDMGNVSKVVPSIHPTIGIDSLPHLPHQRGFAEAACSPAADRAIVEGAIALAWTAIDLGSDPEIREAVRADFERSRPC